MSPTSTKIWFFIAAFLLCQPAKAQTTSKEKRYTDSLEHLVKIAPSDTEKALLLDHLSSYWYQRNPHKASGYSKHAIKVARGHPFFSAAAHFHMGLIYYFNQPQKSRKEFERTLSFLKNDSSKRAYSLASTTWIDLGELGQRSSGNDTTFLNIMLNRAMPLAQKSGNKLKIALIYNNIGIAFSNVQNYDKAIHYYKKAINMASPLPKRPGKLAGFYIELINGYLKKQNRSQSDIVQSKKYLDSTYNIIKSKPFSAYYPRYYKALGFYNLSKQKWNQSLQNLDTAIEMAERLHLHQFKGEIIYQKYQALLKMKDLSKAKELLLSLYHDSTQTAWGSNKKLYLNQLARLNAQMGNMEQAYKWMFKYANFSDSLHKDNVKEKVAALEAKYKSEQKQKEILNLENKTKQQELKIQKKTTQDVFLFGSLLLLVLICIIIYIFYRSKRRQSLQRIELQKQQLEQVKQQNQLKVYNAMMEGQEQERRRMARDLHDGLGGMLSSVKLKLSGIAATKKDQKNTELYPVIDQLDHSVEELRNIARNMMPETLLRFGVETAIRDLCHSLETDHTHVDFQPIQLSKDLPQSLQVSLYRIVQELTNNAIRHGGAENILIQISQNEHHIFITVEDDGVGFSPDVLKKKKGIGIANVKSRINLLGGHLNIDSAPGEGTIINIEINELE